MRVFNLILLRRLCLKYNFTHQIRNISSEKQTHFGFENIPEKEKEERVHKVFSNVAEKYDLMNDVMSMGVHRLWKDYFVDYLSPSNKTSLLDVAGGTGDITFRYIKHLKNQMTSDLTPSEVKVTVLDINQAMLDVGKRRAQKIGLQKNINWVLGNAEDLPFDDNSFDLYTVAYGIRNMTHIDKVLSEAHRVLKKGGRFGCLEFSKVQNILLNKLYDGYSFQMIPVMGKLIAGDWKSYKYLVESIRKFPSQEEFSHMIKEAGFHGVRHQNLFNGISAIHTGFKF